MSGSFRFVVFIEDHLRNKACHHTDQGDHDRLIYFSVPDKAAVMS